MSVSEESKSIKGDPSASSLGTRSVAAGSRSKSSLSSPTSHGEHSPAVNGGGVEARVDSCIAYCQYSVEKTRLFSTATSQLVSLVVLLLLALIQSPPHTSLTLFDRKRLLLSEEAAEVVTVDSARDWFIKATELHYTMRVDGGNESFQGHGLHGTVPLVLSEFKSFLTPRLSGISSLNDLCSTSGAESQLSALPSDSYSAVLAEACAGLSSAAVTEENVTTTERFYFTSSEEDVLDSRARLSSLATSAAVTPDHMIEARFIFYTQSTDSYTFTEAEFNPLLGKLNILTQPISFPRLNEVWGIVFLVLLCSYSLAVLGGLWLTMKSLRLEREVKGDWSGVVSAKTTYDLLVVGFSIAYAIYGFLFIVKSDRLRTGSSTSSFDPSSYSANGTTAAALELFEFMRDMSGHLRTQLVLLAWAIMLAVMRPLFYLQYLSRLSAVSETIVSSIPSLVGCALVFFLIMITFSITGSSLFGSKIFEFRSPGETIKFLFILVFREGSLEYGDFFKAAPYSAVIFFLLFACLSQVVVLNIVVGVIAASFSASVSTMELVRNPDWSLAAIAVDLKRFVSRKVRRFRQARQNDKNTKQSRRPGSVRGQRTNEPVETHPDSGDVKLEEDQDEGVALSREDQILYVYERLTCLDALRWGLSHRRVKHDTLLTQGKLSKLIEDFRLATTSSAEQEATNYHHQAISSTRGGGSLKSLSINKNKAIEGPAFNRGVPVPLISLAIILKKASVHIGTSDAVLRQSRTTLQRMARTERMEHQLSVQIKTVGELHRTFFGEDAEVEGDGGRAAGGSGGADKLREFAKIRASGGKKSRLAEAVEDTAGANLGSDDVNDALLLATERVIGGLEKVRQQSDVFESKLDKIRGRLKNLTEAK